jgi:transcriptional regulator with XRE-family HTH domain
MLYMQIGRPSKRPRTAFGERLFAARTAAGLSQAELAQKLGINCEDFATSSDETISSFDQSK